MDNKESHKILYLTNRIKHLNDLLEETKLELRRLENGNSNKNRNK